MSHFIVCTDCECWITIFKMEYDIARLSKNFSSSITECKSFFSDGHLSFSIWYDRRLSSGSETPVGISPFLDFFQNRIPNLSGAICIKQLKASLNEVYGTCRYREAGRSRSTVTNSSMGFTLCFSSRVDAIGSNVFYQRLTSQKNQIAIRSGKSFDWMRRLESRYIYFFLSFFLFSGDAFFGSFLSGPWSARRRKPLQIRCRIRDSILGSFSIFEFRILLSVVSSLIPRVRLWITVSGRIQRHGVSWMLVGF